jgi:hypothetical protein
MTKPIVLVATWSNGLFIVTDTPHQEFADQSVKSLVSDDAGGVLAIVGGHSLCRRAPDGGWATIATSEFELACCVPVGETIYVGTDDARVLRVDPSGAQQQLAGFDAVAGREKWYAGTALIDGRLMGPPLGIRSMAATCDDAVLLANVHVGGIPRSDDGGSTWRPTIDIDHDVHQVCAHPTRPDIVIAAAAAGLCVSRDGGSTWSTEQEGLHASYCSAVAFVGDTILVAASEGHFAARGAVYRRPLDSGGPLLPVGGGLPRWIDGIADTGCIAVRGSAAAVVDRAGNLYTSDDAGSTWSNRADGLPSPSSLFIS